MVDLRYNGKYFVNEEFIVLFTIIIEAQLHCHGLAKARVQSCA